jgi:hypothetical protein
MGLDPEEPAFLRALDEAKEVFVADVHRTQQVWIAEPGLHVPPPKPGCGRPAKRRPATTKSVTVDALAKTFGAADWMREYEARCCCVCQRRHPCLWFRPSADTRRHGVGMHGAQRRGRGAHPTRPAIAALTARGSHCWLLSGSTSFSGWAWRRSVLASSWGFNHAHCIAGSALCQDAGG